MKNVWKKLIGFAEQPVKKENERIQSSIINEARNVLWQDEDERLQELGDYIKQNFDYLPKGVARKKGEEMIQVHFQHGEISFLMTWDYESKKMDFEATLFNHTISIAYIRFDRSSPTGLEFYDEFLNDESKDGFKQLLYALPNEWEPVVKGNREEDGLRKMKMFEKEMEVLNQKKAEQMKITQTFEQQLSK